MRLADGPEALSWLEAAASAAELHLEPVCFGDCQGWHLRDGALRHETGRFFSVRAVTMRSRQKDVDGRQMVMIDQPEIGRLAFLVRPSGEGVDWLIQAKVEPGNVGPAQLAPTLQATRSNYERVHGGRPTAFLELFQGGRTFLSDGAFSEQGSSFLWKFNRNTVLAVPSAGVEIPDADHWRWCSSRTLRELLSCSYAVNTDARSVIASAPWALLCEGRTLFRSPALMRSYRRHDSSGVIRQIVDRAATDTRLQIAWEFEPLEAHPGWNSGAQCLAGSDGAGRLGSFAVSVKGREVGHWMQPFLLGGAHSEHVLLMRLADGVPEFFARVLSEPGFGARREYGPSLHSAYSAPADLEAWVQDGRELVEIEQSDEGGRFMQTRALYRIVLVEDTPPPRSYPWGTWLPLASLEQLARKPGMTSNELRTLCTLILSDAFDVACQTL